VKKFLVPFTVSVVLFLVILAMLGGLQYWPVAVFGAVLGTLLGVGATLMSFPNQGVGAPTPGEHDD
jgi:hypothetical protein